MITCPECGCKKTNVYATDTRWNRKHSAYKRYVKCRECGKHFTTIEQTTDKIKDFPEYVDGVLTQMRAAMNCSNTDYKIGYLSAVSYLEGCVAEYELDKS